MNERSARIKPSTLECIAIFLDRRRRPAINFIECGSSGFGDRLRGIAYALFLAKKHNTTKIYYSQALVGSDNIERSHFPFSMTELVAIRGMDFVPFTIPVELNTATYVHYSQAGNPLKRYGFSEMWRIEPKQPAVIRRLQGISDRGPYLAIHIRKTDAEHRADKLDATDELALTTLREQSRRTTISRVYIAADNAASFAEWRVRLADDGFDVVENSASFDAAKHRQTGSEDTMVDFFALSRAQVLVRPVPSEFSRFAAWVGNKRLRYNDLI